jgi:radical SAM family RiPP maturation amino acid epimerase
MVFELAKGCSMGCWFCGLAAGRLEGLFPRTHENKVLWRSILRVCHDEFGESAQSGFCYCATEPSDNPDYLDFVRDFHEIIRVYPCTTTAAPLKDLDWTRWLLRYAADEKSGGCRFSITTLKTLRQVHEEFTPEELFATELLLQNRESLTGWRSSGKYRQYALSKNLVSDLDDPGGYDAGTISCVTGFHVNMVDKQILLMTPCFASERWPLGYRVYWRGSFTNATEFREAIHDAIEHHMQTALKGPDIVKFNDLLSYEPRSDGFFVETPFRSCTIDNNPLMRDIGELALAGDMTTSEVLKALVDKGYDFLEASGALQHLFERGIIDDHPPRELEGSP